MINPEPDAASAPPAWRFTEELRIGEAEGDGPGVFGRVSALAVGGDGRIHVFDAHARELRTFAPDGRFERRFGRRGDGPGEFESVIGMDVAPDGAVWLVDPLNARYTVVRRDGIEIHRRPSTVYRMPWTGGFGPEGRFHDAVVLAEEGIEAIVRVGADGRIFDTTRIAEPPLPPRPRIGTITLEVPFAPRALRAWDPRGGVWTGTTHARRFTYAGAAGDTLLVVVREGAEPPLGAAARDSARRAAERMRTELGVAVTGEMFPTRAPVVRWFVTDGEGGLWVAEGSENDDDGEPVGRTRLEMFDGRGRWAGRLVLPYRIVPGVRAVIRGDRLWAVVEDALGVQAVVVGRVGRRSTGVAERDP